MVQFRLALSALWLCCQAITSSATKRTTPRFPERYWRSETTCPYGNRRVGVSGFSKSSYACNLHSPLSGATCPELQGERLALVRNYFSKNYARYVAAASEFQLAPLFDKSSKMIGDEGYEDMDKLHIDTIDNPDIAWLEDKILLKKKAEELSIPATELYYGSHKDDWDRESFMAALISLCHRRLSGFLIKPVHLSWSQGIKVVRNWKQICRKTEAEKAEERNKLADYVEQEVLAKTANVADRHLQRITPGVSVEELFMTGGVSTQPLEVKVHTLWGKVVNMLIVGEDNRACRSNAGAWLMLPDKTGWDFSGIVPSAGAPKDINNEILVNKYLDVAMEYAEKIAKATGADSVRSDFFVGLDPGKTVIKLNEVETVSGYTFNYMHQVLGSMWRDGYIVSGRHSVTTPSWATYMQNVQDARDSFGLDFEHADPNAALAANDETARRMLSRRRLEGMERVAEARTAARFEKAFPERRRLAGENCPYGDMAKSTSGEENNGYACHFRSEGFGKTCPKLQTARLKTARAWLTSRYADVVAAASDYELKPLFDKTSPVDRVRGDEIYENMVQYHILGLDHPDIAEIEDKGKLKALARKLGVPATDSYYGATLSEWNPEHFRDALSKLCVDGINGFIIKAVHLSWSAGMKIVKNWGETCKKPKPELDAQVEKLVTFVEENVLGVKADDADKHLQNILPGVSVEELFHTGGFSTQPLEAKCQVLWGKVVKIWMVGMDDRGCQAQTGAWNIYPDKTGWDFNGVLGKDDSTWDPRSKLIVDKYLDLLIENAEKFATGIGADWTRVDFFLKFPENEGDEVEKPIKLNEAETVSGLQYWLERSAVGGMWGDGYIASKKSSMTVRKWQDLTDELQADRDTAGLDWDHPGQLESIKDEGNGAGGPGSSSNPAAASEAAAAGLGTDNHGFARVTVCLGAALIIGIALGAFCTGSSSKRGGSRQLVTPAGVVETHDAVELNPVSVHHR